MASNRSLVWAFESGSSDVMVKEIPSLIRAHAADALAAENQKEYVEYFYQVKLDRRINATQKPSNHLFPAKAPIVISSLKICKTNLPYKNWNLFNALAPVCKINVRRGGEGIKAGFKMTSNNKGKRNKWRKREARLWRHWNAKSDWSVSVFAFPKCERCFIPHDAIL